MTGLIVFLSEIGKLYDRLMNFLWVNKALIRGHEYFSYQVPGKIRASMRARNCLR
jgi:hypothetical protein